MEPPQPNVKSCWGGDFHVLATGQGYKTRSVHSKLDHCCGCLLTAERRSWLLSNHRNCVSEVRQGVDPLLCRLYFYWEFVNVVRSAHGLHNGLKCGQQLSIWLGFRSWMTIAGCCGLHLKCPTEAGSAIWRGLVGEISLGCPFGKYLMAPILSQPC